MKAKYKLDIKRDVDIDGQPSSPDGYILNLPYGWRIYDEVCHTRGFDSMKELREYASKFVVKCDCQECTENL